MTALELLAPARNLQIGIAAIDCGADAVYIAGPSYGARKDAANSVEDIKELCAYAHRFGAKIFVTVNTIVFDSELQDCYRLMLALQDAGADALIVQDAALLALAGGGPDGKGQKVTIPLHASTQCAIRTPQKALDAEKAGFSRIVLERQLSLEEIKAIRSAVSTEIECFVHGALCVCYSGECYLSEKLTGRSANRGACIQACRTRFDLTDSAGNVIERDRAFLSLKDLQLLGRLEDMAAAGVCSFKIEGRLKNLSYVKNTVTAYSAALNALVAKNPGLYRRSSEGRVENAFKADLNRTFNRGYTSLFIDGKRGPWASSDAPKSMGEKLGKVLSVKSLPGGMSEIKVDTRATLANGDGFAWAAGGSVYGFRGDVCHGNTIVCKRTDNLTPGAVLYRNISAEYEKEISSTQSRRVIDVNVKFRVGSGLTLKCTASSSDGRSVTMERCFPDAPVARSRERMLEMISGSLSKNTGHYVFKAVPSEELISDTSGELPLLSASVLNGIRRELAGMLDTLPCTGAPLMNSSIPEHISMTGTGSFKDNIANALSSSIYDGEAKNAYELNHPSGVELMRSRYCIRYELGLCPKQAKGGSQAQSSVVKGGSLWLTGNGKPLELRFDCLRCEMSVIG